MSEALLLLPDFALIAIGWLVCRYTALNRPLWEGVERLVYMMLFPALLFSSVARSPLSLSNVAPVAGSALVVLGVGIAAALALQAWPGVDRRLHASGAQTAFRFNTYVAFAMAQRLEGSAGLAWMAVLLAVSVPVVNVAAVWPLARQGGHHFGKELLRNPLILATAAGLLFKGLGLHLPDMAHTTLTRLGSAAVPLGLMAVGAGLQVGALRLAPGLALALMAIRHMLIPAVAVLLMLRSELPATQQSLLVAFAAMPTASSSYVLAARMGGHGPYTAGLVTLSTLLAMVTLPLWLGIFRALSGS